jgi:aminoglycoside phosphotransferase family enzyme/predicted kinase
MQDDIQAQTREFLTDPGTHGVSAAEIVVIQTHISFIVLAGSRAFKLKRAVHLSYVDFSTCSLRLSACMQELALNRRTAPAVYLAVRRVTRESDGHLMFDGDGELVDAVVEMTRFDQDALFDKLAERGKLTESLLGALAHAAARFHADASTEYSVASQMLPVLEMNERAFRAVKAFSEQDVSNLNSALREAFHHHAALLDSRAKAGKVRRCHGDLHLRNICLIEGAPVFFDCIEFDDAIATIDILYDLSFLLMDLWRLGLRSAANLVFNRYLDECDETDGLPLLPFFMALRASIRAHVSATEAEASTGTAGKKLADEAHAYFSLASELLRTAPPRLVAIGGLSGTGKSALAMQIADRIGPPPGARILSSDRIRKRLYGVSPETRLSADAYLPEISERIYAIQASEAQKIVADGWGVIADAVFGRTSDCQRIERIAAENSVRFSGLRLVAPPAMMLARVASRCGNPSDADVAVVRAQLAQGVCETGWTVIKTDASLDAITERALAMIDVAAVPN